MRSFTKGTGVAVETPTGEKFLILQIEIDCEFCDLWRKNLQQEQDDDKPPRFRFCGRHARSLRDWLIQTIDDYPGYTGEDKNVRLIDKTVIEGAPPRRPEDN